MFRYLYSLLARRTAANVLEVRWIGSGPFHLKGVDGAPGRHDRNFIHPGRRKYISPLGLPKSSRRAESLFAGTFAFYVKTRKATPSDVLRLQHGESASTSGRNLTSGAPETRRLSGGLGRITSPKSPPPTLEPASSPRKAMPSVILVEDNLINQTVLSKQLRRLGCTVHIANHGVEALDLVKTTRFWREQNGVGIDVSVILMDWEMPVMDGLTCTEQLRVMEQKGVVTKHLPVIATTANARPEQVQRAFAAGVVSAPSTFS
jgi:CheY-like chemotaxis protein